MIRQVPFTLPFFVLISSGLFAQSITSSPYSVYGVGVLKKRTSSLNRGLAGTGIGIRDQLNLNSTNPASYTSIEGITQLFEIGIFYENTKVQTSDLSQTYRSGNLNAINLWFRYSQRWAGTIGLSPYSNVNYSIHTEEVAAQGGTSEVNYTGLGGLTQLYWGNAIQITPNLSFGVNASYLFGTLKKNKTVTVQTSKATLTSNIFAHRLNADFGLQYSFKIQEGKKLTLGLVYEDNLRLKTSTEKLFYSQTSSDTIKLKTESIDDYILPRKLGGGIAYQTNSSTFAIDLAFEEWSKAKLEDGLNLQNTLRLSAGYEYKGNYKDGRYLNMINLRSGFYAQQNYLVLKNTPLNEWGFSLGLGLPVTYGKSTIGLSYNYNSSGTTKNDLVKQHGSVFVLDVTIRDIWGARRRID